MIQLHAAVVGDAEAKAGFLNVESAIRNRVRGALVELGRGGQQLAQGWAPKLTGKMSAAISLKLSESDKRMSVTVAPKGRQTLIARLMEFGVVSHPTGSHRDHGVRGVRTVRWLRSTGQYRVSPRPFMGPAEEAIRGRVQGTLEAAVAAAVED